jgi:GntR family transcriptional regulator/MocR family aminotransferase
MGSDGILSQSLADAKAKVLHITPFNSFPSGITATASKRREYLRWAKEHNAIIIEDDFDSEFSGLTKREDTVFSLSDEGRVIYMNTFSKTIAPSIRMGYMVIPNALMPLFSEKAGFYSCTVSVLEQLIVAEFIESGDFERHLNRTRRKRRTQM